MPEVIMEGTKLQTLGGGSLQFIGTATVLIRYGDVMLLTDPNFLHKGDHVHLGYGLFSKRLTDPALEIEQLPPLDAVLLSHLHGDHFDRVASRKLGKQLPIITTRHAAAALRRRGFRKAMPLRNWQSYTITKEAAKASITSLPGRHGPSGFSLLLPPVMGSLIELSPAAGQGRAFRIYISGDTLVYDDLKEIPRRYPDIDLALLHLGGTRVLGVLVTMDSEQGIRMINLIHPEVAIPIHYNDYKVFKDPLENFMKAVDKAGLGDRVQYLAHGDTYHFSASARAQGARIGQRRIVSG